MRTQSKDTNVKIEKAQISLLQKQSISEKFAHVCSLTETTIKASKRAIVEANQGLSQKELKLLFIEYQYGKELATQVKNYLKCY
ncbi:MAG: hypothetical protein K9M80_02010 [Candidatus Marinimicrobia bacterium]|nr:hypothetical protein [Candidatus Neomarinimicrobiota bacterium]